jgi:hypothetical protein
MSEAKRHEAPLAHRQPGFGAASLPPKSLEIGRWKREQEMTDTVEMPIWLTTAEAAPHLRKTPETLINWATCGRIPKFAWRALPKGYLFLASWVGNPVFTTASSDRD